MKVLVGACSLCIIQLTWMSAVCLRDKTAGVLQHHSSSFPFYFLFYYLKKILFLILCNKSHLEVLWGMCMLVQFTFFLKRFEITLKAWCGFLRKIDNITRKFYLEQRNEKHGIRIWCKVETKEFNPSEWWNLSCLDEWKKI